MDLGGSYDGILPALGIGLEGKRMLFANNVFFSMLAKFVCLAVKIQACCLLDLSRIWDVLSILKYRSVVVCTISVFMVI